MSETVLTCDQAIFTSVRTPMGEGYRIIAASRGLCLDEKQAITRNSPSHEGLCTPSDSSQAREQQVAGVTFYSLPSGRLCVTLSCFAGAEHTGRGGKRVYTHCVIFDEDAFPRCGYNPLNVLRSMVKAGLASPKLRPPAVLPELQLTVADSAGSAGKPSLHPSLGRPCRCRVLEALFDDRRLIVDIESGWLESAEALLLGLPGPLRARVSFGAGLRFSVGRCHHLHLLHDDKGVARTRIAGQPVEYLDPRSISEMPMGDSAWIAFVDRLWETGDTETLANRTSRAFVDVSAGGREHIARLYNEIDEIADTDTAELLDRAGNALRNDSDDVERDIADQLVAKAQKTVCARFDRGGWAKAKQYWPRIVSLWRKPTRDSLFAQPLIYEALRVAMREEPMAAAEVALDVSRSIPAGVDKQEHAAMLDEVLNRLAAWTETNQSNEPQQLQYLCEQWRRLRPGCPILDRLRERLAAFAASH